MGSRPGGLSVKADRSVPSCFSRVAIMVVQGPIISGVLIPLVLCVMIVATCGAGGGGIIFLVLLGQYGQQRDPFLDFQ